METLPASSVVQTAKLVLADQGCRINADGKTALNRAASMFILCLAAAARDVTQGRKRTTMSGADVARALGDMGLPELVEPLREAMAQVAGVAQRKRAAKRARMAAPHADEVGAEGEDAVEEEEEEEAAAGVGSTEAAGEAAGAGMDAEGHDHAATR